MNNIELEQKVKEIIEIDNYFDAIEQIIAFEKEYKNSDFFKKTKMPLEKVIREARIHYALQFKNFGDKLQKMINELDLNKFNELLDQIGATFGAENEEILKDLEVLKDLKA